MQEVLEKIKEQLEFYNERSDKMQIPQLLRMQDVLSINSFYLAECLDLANKDSTQAYMVRKYKVLKTFHTKKLEGMNDKAMTDKMAQTLADGEAEVEFSKEVEKQAITYGLDIKLKQINRVLSSIQQRISSLKQELNINK